MPRPPSQRVDTPPPSRDELLREARQRLTQLEIETHRLRAELARLEAAGEDEAAARLAEQLAAETRRLDRDRSIVDAAAPVGALARPTVATPGSGTGAGDASPFDGLARPDRAPVDSGGTAAKRGRRSKRLPPAWWVSIAAHVVLAVLLAGLTFAVPGQRLPLLSASMGESENLDDFVEVSLEAPDVSEALEPEPMLADDLTLQPILEPTPLAEFDALVTPADFQLDAMEVLPADAAGLMNAYVESLPGQGGNAKRERPTSSRASFFGSKSHGDRIVFVVDNSGSMTGGRLETTLFELMNSVSAMSPRHEFHVLFYSDQVYPMFYPEPAPGLAPATRENKQRLQRWLGEVQMCKGDCLTDAMDHAAAMAPDVVYLLSDGGYLFTGKGVNRSKSRKLRYLTEEVEDWGFTVHTLGMTVRGVDAAEGLTLIAQTHGGTFRPVGVRPDAAALAKQRPVRYNRTPGPVWGLSVR